MTSVRLSMAAVIERRLGITMTVEQRADVNVLVAERLREIVERADNAEADAQHAREESLSAFEAVAGAQTCERAARADAARLAEALRAALDLADDVVMRGAYRDSPALYEAICALRAALAAHDAGTTNDKEMKR